MSSLSWLEWNQYDTLLNDKRGVCRSVKMSWNSAWWNHLWRKSFTLFVDDIMVIIMETKAESSTLHAGWVRLSGIQWPYSNSSIFIKFGGIDIWQEWYSNSFRPFSEKAFVMATIKHLKWVLILLDGAFLEPSQLKPSIKQFIFSLRVWRLVCSSSTISKRKSMTLMSHQFIDLCKNNPISTYSMFCYLLTVVWCDNRIWKSKATPNWVWLVLQQSLSTHY